MTFVNQDLMTITNSLRSDNKMSIRPIIVWS
jgi:hypothetical protein